MRYILLSVVLLGALSACSMQEEPETEKAGEGKIRVSIQPAYNTESERSVFPNVSLDDVHHYALWGALAGTAETALIPSFARNASIALNAGTWDFTVKGYNTADALILQGERKNQVVSLSSNSFSFSLSPLLGGTGSILITITLPSGSGVTTVTVFKDGEAETAQPVIDDRITYSVASVATGNYFYSFRLNNNEGNTIAVVSETVRVRAALWSEKVIELTTTDLNAPPATPAAPLIEAGDGQLTVSWDAVPLIGDYEVYYGTTATPPVEPAQAVSNTTTTVIGGLTNGTLYYVWIKAENVVGISGFSPAASGKPIGTPAAPSISAGSGNLLVSWTAVAGADEYEVYCGTSSIPTTLYATASDTSITITGLTNETLYYVRLRAKNETGVSSYSEVASGTPSIATLMAGLYDGMVNTACKIDSQNLADSVSYLSSNAVTGHDYFIVLGDDESSPNINLSYSGKTVGVTIMGVVTERTINLSADTALFTVGTGVTLTLDDNITLIGRSSNTNNSLVSVTGTLIMNDGSKIKNNGKGGVQINTAGRFTMNGGEISGNTNSFYGGGVFGLGGTFTMNRGKISGNSATLYGGGVFIYGNGTFIMNDGEISGNTVSNMGGGGVCVSSGTFTMNDGKISGNTADDAGGVRVDGTFTMSGGTISQNTTSRYGGGVHVGSGTFTMSEGIISENTGGGVYVSGGSFTMEGGTISENTTSNRGGGVSVISGSSGNFTMSGGIISNNTASSASTSGDGSGGGVYFQSDGILTVDGGTINNNTASSFGGGVFVSQGTFTMTRGSISGNTTTNFGGGVDFDGRGTFTMSGGTISGNTASGSGGVHAGNGTTFTMSGGTISGNIASSSYGGGVYSGGTFTMSGGTISGNTAPSSYGGGVYSSETFKKAPPADGGSNSGIIYGAEASGIDADGIPLKNTANGGDAVYYYQKMRNTTAGQTDQIDTTTGKGLSASGNVPFGE